MDFPIPVPPAAIDPGLPTVTIARPVRQTAAVVFASPHSGRAYPEDFLGAARLDPLSLRRSEDSFVDALFAAAPDHGAPLLAAQFPRAFCDVNREPWELDPSMFDGALPPWVNTTSPRVGAGLGTIPRVVATGETIYRRKLAFSEAERRVRLFWQPYHDALSELIEATHAAHGACLLIDCHSMPRQSVAGRAPDFILGDAHGTACRASVTRMAETVLSGLGYAVRRNDPYAGGYVTRHYGRPRAGRHALQIEIARHLYMDESRIEPLPCFDSFQRDITTLIAKIARETPALIG